MEYEVILMEEMTPSANGPQSRLGLGGAGCGGLCFGLGCAENGAGGVTGGGCGAGCVGGLCAGGTGGGGCGGACAGAGCGGLC